jgi:hypothetical protein
LAFEKGAKAPSFTPRNKDFVEKTNNALDLWESWCRENKMKIPDEMPEIMGGRRREMIKFSRDWIVLNKDGNQCVEESIFPEINWNENGRKPGAFGKVVRKKGTVLKIKPFGNVLLSLKKPIKGVIKWTRKTPKKFGTFFEISASFRKKNFGVPNPANIRGNEIGH